MELKIAYIGGGSRGWAWKFMADLAGDNDIGGTIALYDIDKQAAKNNEIIGDAVSNAAAGKWRYTTADSLETALKGADFIICSILPGTFAEMRSDVHLPERHGIYQSVGDTAGPGGIVRALRTIPMYVVIAEAIEKFAPQAWVVNYTNPMTLCVQTLYRVFPKIKAFGCCHEVFGTQEVLAGIFEQMTGEKNVTRHEIQSNVVGINHFTWFTSAACRGRDLFPIYREYAEKNRETGYSQNGKDWTKSTFDSMNRVKFDLFLKYGYIAAAGDRHLAEFMPGGSYLKDPATVKSWSFGLTTVDWRENDLAERLARSERLISKKESVSLERSGEEGVQLIKALAGLGRFISNVNVPNVGQISNAPLGAVVESNAVFEYKNVRPIVAGEMPEDILKLTQPHFQNHKLTLDAALECDFGKAFEAFKNDPLVKGRISDNDAEVLLKDMIRNTLKYLPQKWAAV